MVRETRPKDYPKLKNYQPTRFIGVCSLGYDEMIFRLNFLWLVTSGFHPTFVKVAFFRWF